MRFRSDSGLPGEDVRLTLSAGVACHGSESQGTSEDLLQAADAALYRAKRSGRDRVLIADGGKGTTAEGESNGHA